MNGFKLLADAAEQIGETRQAELFGFLGECSESDFCILFNSSAFNEIAKGYLRRACEELEKEGEITEDQGETIRRRFALLFSELKAEDILQKGGGNE